MNRAPPLRDRLHRSANPGGQSDLAWLCVALSDWSAELRILDGRFRGCSRRRCHAWRRDQH